MVTECLKNNSALIGDSVCPIPEIKRVICCGQIFSICRAWTRSSHNERVACYLVQKGHGHRIPKKNNFCTIRGGGAVCDQ